MWLLILPILIVALFTGVESWMWRGILLAVVLVALKFLGPAWIAVAVALIIGIAIKNSLSKIGGSKI